MLAPLLLFSLAQPAAAPAGVLPVDPPAPKLRAALVEALRGRLDPAGRPLAPAAAPDPGCARDELECLQSAAGAVDGDGVRWVIAPAVFRVGEQRYLELVFAASDGDAGTRAVPLDDDAPDRALDGVFPRLSPGPYAILVDGVDGPRREELHRALGDALSDLPRVDPAQVAAARAKTACEGDCLAKIGAACGARHVVRALAKPAGEGALAVSVEIVRVHDDTEVARSLQTWRGGALGPVVDPGPQTRVMVAGGEARGLIRVDGRVAGRMPQVAPLAGVEPGEREIAVAQKGGRSWRATVPIRPHGLVEVAAPAAGAPGAGGAAGSAVEVALGPREVLGKARILIAGLDGAGDLERRVAAAVGDFAPELEVRLGRELRGGLDCADTPCAIRLAGGAGAGTVIIIERVFSDGQHRISLSRLDGERVKTVEVREPALHAGVGAVLDREISPWPYVGAIAMVAGLATGVGGLVLGGLSSSERRDANLAASPERRAFHEQRADELALGAGITIAAGLALVVAGGILVWSE